MPRGTGTRHGRRRRTRGRMGVAVLVGAGGLLVSVAPAGAVGTGLATALSTQDNVQQGDALKGVQTTVSLHQLPPNPISPNDPYYPGYGQLTAAPLGVFVPGE
jgi:hypothetical protein